MARDAMRVLHRDPKTGEIKVRVENADDLWHLHNLVLPGDLVRASTYRREEVKTDKVRRASNSRRSRTAYASPVSSSRDRKTWGGITR